MMTVFSFFLRYTHYRTNRQAWLGGFFFLDHLRFIFSLCCLLLSSDHLILLVFLSPLLWEHLQFNVRALSLFQSSMSSAFRMLFDLPEPFTCCFHSIIFVEDFLCCYKLLRDVHIILVCFYFYCVQQPIDFPCFHSFRSLFDFRGPVIFLSISIWLV